LTACSWTRPRSDRTCSRRRACVVAPAFLLPGPPSAKERREQEEVRLASEWKKHYCLSPVPFSLVLRADAKQEETAAVPDFRFALRLPSPSFETLLDYCPS
jgi:hypothetical protein